MAERARTALRGRFSLGLGKSLVSRTRKLPALAVHWATGDPPGRAEKRRVARAFPAWEADALATELRPRARILAASPIVQRTRERVVGHERLSVGMPGD